MEDDLARFSGDYSSLWRLDIMPPLPRLSWWWWWVILFIPDPDNPSRSRQLMVLWSSKETPAIRVNDHWWKPGSRMRVDENRGHVVPGMVCSWWYDGKEMHEPLLMKECKMFSLDDKHPLWPIEGNGEGSGAVIPLVDDDLSLGLTKGNKKFWLNLTSSEAAQKKGAPKSFKAELTPWWGPPSKLTYKNNVFFSDMGYDILRIQGTKASIKIDNEDFEGTGYFQKVSVQAPTLPWFWGMLHFDDGSYLDWFMPHLSFSCLNMDDKPWKLRDIFRNPKIGSGIFHDANRDKTEEFKNCEVELIEPVNEEILTDNDGNKLPKFRVRLWNETTKISLEVRAASRAKWTFDQPTRAGMVSHLTYNEYPLELLRISISDEQGLRTKNDYSWIHGNAEHSWGLLH
ncbi:MAG: hypothetical protein QF610_01800 [Candidatus Thalassarchaeaceae archaeon]|jgi:hypothetical protein|nr:hypothetical protein [Candidatus Thalassarchaeaceae archaeon]|tara:strand:- start:180 stop:1376 length:1197 start_codon:yes stop_codon:yes gene_type:complete